MLKHRILIVDDDQTSRNLISEILTAQGYEVATAINGFDALVQLRGVAPDLVVSDLNMPNMSGFEFLSVVRRRFPSISVIAMSAAYQPGRPPIGAIADAFYAKGQSHITDLLQKIRELLPHNQTRLSRAHELEAAPVWIPRNGRSSTGVPFVVLTCPECLRSFPQDVPNQHPTEYRLAETECLYCSSEIHFVIDFTIPVPKNVVIP